MKFEITSWMDGGVLFSGEFGSLKLCVEAAVSRGVGLNYASLDNASLVNARLDNARLDNARLDNARLDYARLDNARLDNASLVNARLVNARLDNAILDNASLVNASLVNARLAANLGWPNGWFAFTHCTQGTQRIRVGCHDFSIAEARKYWKGEKGRREVLAAVDYAEAIGKLRGWGK